MRCGDAGIRDASKRRYQGVTMFFAFRTPRRGDLLQNFIIRQSGCRSIAERVLKQYNIQCTERLQGGNKCQPANLETNRHTGAAYASISCKFMEVGNTMGLSVSSGTWRGKGMVARNLFRCSIVSSASKAGGENCEVERVT